MTRTAAGEWPVMPYAPFSLDASPACRVHEPSPDLPAWLRRVACISTSRADSGIYGPLLAALADAGLDVFCLAGGTHLSAAYGATIHGISADPRVRVVPVDHLVSGDEPRQIADTAGRAVIAFSSALAATQPGLVFVLGDRTEMLAAALAALIHKTPIAHLHGGDATEGAYDEQCRHAITKLAHVHFPALPGHAERIACMGEEPWRTHAVGALALDALSAFIAEPPGELLPRFGLDPARPTAVVVYHPETLTDTHPAVQVGEIAAALAPLDLNLLVVDPNADAGREAIAAAWRALAASRPRLAVVSSLSQRDFWSLLASAAVLVGNSSAGIIESASFRIPVINIGDRQAGRVRAANVLDVPADRSRIASALKTALEPAFRDGLSSLVNPWGDGGAARRIVDALRGLPGPAVLLRKKWPLSHV